MNQNHELFATNDKVILIKELIILKDWSNGNGNNYIKLCSGSIGKIMPVNDTNDPFPRVSFHGVNGAPLSISREFLQKVTTV